MSVPRDGQRGPFVGKKRKKIWNSIPLRIFWTVWNEREID